MEGEGDRGEGRAVKEREARSEKVILADPIRGSHLLILLSAREALTQAKPAVSYEHNTGRFLFGKQHFIFLKCILSLLYITCTYLCLCVSGNDPDLVNETIH